MGVSENSGTSKSSILIGFSIINHPFWGTPIFGNVHIKPPKPVHPTIKTQADLNVVRSAVQHDGAALEFASDDLRADKEVGGSDPKLSDTKKR